MKYDHLVHTHAQTPRKASLKRTTRSVGDEAVLTKKRARPETYAAWLVGKYKCLFAGRRERCGVVSNAYILPEK